MISIRTLILFALSCGCLCLREFRLWSTRPVCEKSRFPNYPFAYAKYDGQIFEGKGRVNTNEQDFRHDCQVKGGQSKCNICERIECDAVGDKTCDLQLQGVDNAYMSTNIPVVSDTAWSVGGSHRHDYGGRNVSHFCVLISGGDCIQPKNEDFRNCTVRCFGHGFHVPAQVQQAHPRSIVDVYPGMNKWEDDGSVDLWVYPRNCSDLKKFGSSCQYSGNVSRTPSFNPQGFVFTLAGNATSSAGFVDGESSHARFNGPEDVAVDDYGIIYVADTRNNAIRMVTPEGMVSTIAGRGPDEPGFADGDCRNATFTLPKGLDVRRETRKQLGEVVIIVVADTGNHRIRKIEYFINSGQCTVYCFTGLCGNSTLSATDNRFQATPLTGYADGSGLEARFSSPESVAFILGNITVVADTGNFLLRWVTDTGETSTLAGSVVNGQVDVAGNPLAGCPPPCLAGQQGFRDGNLTHVQFYNILDITKGPENTLWIVDEHRVRLLELPLVNTTLYSIHSRGRVSTVAGNALQGHDDGVGDESTFFNPSGIFVGEDSIIHVVDTASCRIRRVTPMPLVAENATCHTKLVELIRPSGCTSFDQALDKVGKKVSRVEANIQYNYGWPNTRDKDAGKYIKNCVGSPPRDKLDKHFIFPDGDNLVIDDHRIAVNEDSEQGTTIIVHCPKQCDDDSSSRYSFVEGTSWYSEQSSVCSAAIHNGVLRSKQGGYIQVMIQRYDYLNENALYVQGSHRNGISSRNMSMDTHRVFSIQLFKDYMYMVHTVGGHPMAPLESGCGFSDGQPPTLAYFNSPSGISGVYSSPLSDETFVYIADTANNIIRAMSAVCTQICENQGRCVARDTCQCKPGWGGKDCTQPICKNPCGKNKLCVAPDTCACKPGYTGPSCNVAQCVQRCKNNGVCDAPDTCRCPSGWFDSNCTTPVCTLTCANGGTCVGPNRCSCPTQWQGQDCRIPVCQQTCKNNGLCIAPDTCICSPQYTGYDCTVPVCSQGYFKPNPPPESFEFHTPKIVAWPTYKYCDLQAWCNATREFECDQVEMKYKLIEVPSNGSNRAITGRKERPTQCMIIELPITYKIPFELVKADDNGTTTGYLRYSPKTPYESNPRNLWRGYFNPVDGRTGPWTYIADRQLAQVQWVNITQGAYVCANGGLCVAPDVCECSPNWGGFDCRTPICEQGYFQPKQSAFVSGQESADEIELFERFMGNNTRRNWPYSNPNYTLELEYYPTPTYTVRVKTTYKGKRYLQLANWTNNIRHLVYQGGYRCSIRALTPWENRTFVFSHPNYYSRYMDSRVQKDGKTYTYWQDMGWPPLHRKSRVLDQRFKNVTYAYTNEGFRRRGVWNVTENVWVFGICIIEFNRTCPAASKKQYDLQTNQSTVLVQDTDISYRPRIKYDDRRVYFEGRWNVKGGECTDEVVRGCFNNGTCIAPNTCRCAQGWTGYSCNVPICEQTCNHHGNCTGPNQCTCERGWTGHDCLKPLCAQECQNGGYCIAPDTCKCKQWANVFRDGRLAGGRPLFRDEKGDPMPTGWTGFDCATPICVQNVGFNINVGINHYATPKELYFDRGGKKLGGHGGDGKMECTTTTATGEVVTLPRCPDYDRYVTGNDGTSFQTGCGYDPFDTGCCFAGEFMVDCYKCDANQIQVSNNTYVCDQEPVLFSKRKEEVSLFTEAGFTDLNLNFKLCGKYHSPRSHDYKSGRQNDDYGLPVYYTSRDALYSSYNDLSNLTSNRFLCNVHHWIQGDYVDDAGLGSEKGMGYLTGLSHGRHSRINYVKMVRDPNSDTGAWLRDAQTYTGEGIYECANQGSCLGPDVCTCTDGYAGYDCNTPLCRHLQPTGHVSSCLNDGICVKKDKCNCVQTSSVSWKLFPLAPRGVTGWTGSDCSIPMCSQGYFDPFCTDLPQAPAGQGCYRCANAGNCTAPDVCTCAKGWTGFDCRTPVCEIVADPLTRTQLGTVFEDKVISFESDPCGVEAIYGWHGWKGTKYLRGNCTRPNECTCLCKLPYNKKSCQKNGYLCDGPWQDPLASLRDVMTARGPDYSFGSTDCAFGYEGNVDEMDKFTSCHLTIYLPSSVERTSVQLIIALSFVGFMAAVAYYYISQRVKKSFLLAKIERRRSKRSSEESLTKADPNAFKYK